MASSSTPSASGPPPPPLASQATRPVALPTEAITLATRLFAAARSGQTAIFMQALPAGLPPNLTNDKGDTLLMLASYHGHPLLVSLLLAHGADPNVLNDRGQSPLAGAVFKNEAAVIEVLLAGGADPEWGAPSALEAVEMFKMDGLRAKLEGAASRGRMKKGGAEEERRKEGVEGL